MARVAEKRAFEPGDGASIVAVIACDQASQVLDRCSALSENRFNGRSRTRSISKIPADQRQQKPSLNVVGPSLAIGFDELPGIAVPARGAQLPDHGQNWEG